MKYPLNILLRILSIFLVNYFFYLSGLYFNYIKLSQLYIISVSLFTSLQIYFIIIELLNRKN